MTRGGQRRAVRYCCGGRGRKETVTLLLWGKGTKGDSNIAGQSFTCLRRLSLASRRLLGSVPAAAADGMFTLAADQPHPSLLQSSARLWESHDRSPEPYDGLGSLYDHPAVTAT